MEASRCALSEITKRAEGDLTIVLIEHHMQMVMALCDRIEVLEFGVRIAGGKPEEVKANPRVIEAYLGTEGDLP